MKNKRWIYGVIGVIVLLFAGLVYAWSILAAPISEYFTQWSGAELSLTFTICIMFFCLGGLISGLLSEKLGPKIMLKLSAVFFLVGFFMSSKTESIIMLYISYGVIAGLASGFAYNSVLGNVTKFFPDCPGLISGILLMGFGFGSFIIGKVYQAVTPSGAGIDAWRNSFLIFGIILFVIMFLCSFIIRKPTKEELKEITAGMDIKSSKKDNKGVDYKPLEMLKTPSFWLFFIWATLLSAAGLAIVSQARGVAMEAGKLSQVGAGTITTVVGLISIFNGAGRVIFGALYDRIGRSKTMLLNDLVFLIAIGVLMLALKTSSFTLVILGFIFMGLAYGGVTPTNAAFVNGFYGSKNYAVNLSLVNLNLLIASFGSTIAGMLYDNSGSYFTTLIAMIGAVVVGALISFGIKKPTSKVLVETNTDYTLLNNE